MNGRRQLWQTLTTTYARPIPSALESGRLVPSKETCERCHWVDTQDCGACHQILASDEPAPEILKTLGRCGITLPL